MKLVLSILSGIILIGSMSSCTTYVEDRRGHSRGYRSSSSHHGHHSSNYRDRDRDSGTRVRTNVRAPLGISSGVGVDLR
jgi:hypothetical protein